MKVLHVIPSLSRVHGGPSNAIWTMAKALTGRGYEVTVLTTDNDGSGRRSAAEPAVDRDGVRIVMLPQTSEFYTTSLRSIGWLIRHVRHFDVVHTHALFSFIPVIAAWVARWRGVPLIVRPLGTLNAYGLSVRRPLLKRVSLALIERPILRNAFAVHCTSEAEVRDVLAVCPQAKTVVIPLSVPAFDRAPDAAIRALLGDRSGPVVLFLSRMDPKKNIEVLLDAFALLLAERNSLTLLIAGDGDAAYVQSLRARAKALRIDKQVLWAGRVDGVTKAAALSAATVFALPSHSENFGIAAAEALAAGVPCVLSPGVAIAAQVADCGAGIVAEATATATADAIAVYLDSPDRREAASRAARQMAVREYSEEVMGARLAALYVQTLS